MRGFALLLCIGAFNCIYGANRIDLSERMSRHRLTRSAEPVSAEHLVGLAKGEHLESTDAMMTSRHTVKVKYVETYKGLPVIGEEVVIERTLSGQFTEDISGQLLEGIAQDVPSITPVLSKEEALQIALEAERTTAENVLYSRIKLAIHTYTGSENSIRAILVYQVKFGYKTFNVINDMKYIIDANTGQILDYMPLIQTCRYHDLDDYKFVEVSHEGGNENSGKIFYGIDYEGLKVMSRDGITCKMMNPKVAVINLNQTYDNPVEEGVFDDDTDRSKIESEAFTFPCKEGFNDTSNGGFSPVSDTFFAFSVVEKMFKEWYSISPLKRLTMVEVHYGQGYENAYYVLHEGFNNSYEMLVFGDGDKWFHPLVSVGIVAHEMGHGFTGEHSGLEYRLQSGGINEAFSDMTSEVTEAFLHKTQPDWIVGNKVSKKGQHPLRWVSNPKADNSSLEHLEEYCPGINVHYSSGIFNKAFYLLSTTQGWDVKMAYHVFLIANKMYWGPKTDFSEGACGAVKAALDLGFPEDDVTAAFQQVGITPCVKKVFHFQNTVSRIITEENPIEGYFVIDDAEVENITIDVVLEFDEHFDDPESIRYFSLTIQNCDSEIELNVSGNDTERFELYDIKPGRYDVKVEGSCMISVYINYKQIMYTEIVMRKSESFDDTIYGNASFILNKEDLREGTGLLVTGIVSSDSTFYMRYGHEVSEAPVYDYMGKSVSGNQSEIFDCRPRAGVYNLAILDSNGTADTVYEVFVYLIASILSDVE